MTPDFSNAVDPIYLAVLDLLSRIVKQEQREPADEKIRIRSHIDRADNQLGPQNEEWRLAKYALVAWIDDVLHEAAWSGREWWENNLLEIDYFRSRDAATEFFRRAKQAGSLQTRNALEVFYICVMLGFRGVYRKSELVAEVVGHDLDLPQDLGKWARQVAAGIQLAQGRPPILENPREGEGAPALKGKFHLIGALFVLITLGSAAILLFCNKETQDKLAKVLNSQSNEE